MAKKAFDRIKTGLDDAVAFARGDARRGTAIRMAPPVDPKAIRRKLGLSQAEFAARFRINLRTLQDWEQRRVTPDGAARVLLAVIAKEPEAVRRALMT